MILRCKIERFWDKHEKRISAWYLAQKKPDDLIISASPDCIIEPIAKRLGVNYIASEYDREYCVFLNNFMFAKEKARYIFDHDFPVIDSFYSDSLSEAYQIMKYFLKTNKIISGCFGISLFVCVLYILSLDKDEWFPRAGDWFNLLFQLSVGFIINFAFYITQIYIPQYKQNIEANRCISIRISEIVAHMREIFFHLGSKYMDYFNEDDVTDQYMLDLLRKININDRIDVLHVKRIYSIVDNDEMYFSVKEWIITRIEFVESEIDKLMKYYTPYINTELMKTLEDILKSNMHHIMARSFLQLPNEIGFEKINDDIFLKPYFDLMKELEKIGLWYKQ